MQAIISASRRYHAVLAAALLVSAPAGAAVPLPVTTPIEDVVMYAVENNTSELLRYTFETDEFRSIGVIRDPNGNPLPKDFEALCMIPFGPHKGIYAAQNYFENQASRILKINRFDASAEYLPQHIGYRKVEGLVAYERSPGDWVLIGASKEGRQNANGSDGPGNDGPHLFLIDPATGAALPAGNNGGECPTRYNGLAFSPQGDLYGIDGDEHLYRIIFAFDPLFRVVGETNVELSPAYGQLEALEWAYGDNQPAIDCGGCVPDPSWTANGILFSFSDDDDAFLIIHPVTGDVVELQCSFRTFDAEGLIFTTKLRDAFSPILNPVD